VSNSIVIEHDLTSLMPKSATDPYLQPVKSSSWLSFSTLRRTVKPTTNPRRVRSPHPTTANTIPVTYTRMLQCWLVRYQPLFIK